jgi:hypothetical protein
MNSTQVTKQLYFGSPGTTPYVWKNVVIEKRISMNWLYKLYEGSILQDIWLVLTSPTD